MPASPIIQGGIFAAGLAVGVGAASLLISNKQTSRQIAPTAVAVPTPVPVTASSTIIPSSAAPPFPNANQAAPIMVGQTTLSVNPQAGKETAEHLTAENLGKGPAAPVPPASSNSSAAVPGKEKGDRSRSQFKEDEDVPAMFRAQLKDYFRSGYDRGHMVPAADAKTSQVAMDETFYLTNIAPQVGEGFNRHYWAYLEDFCRRLTGNFEDVYVFTVPLYLPAQSPDGKWRVSYEVIGNPPNIAVPTHFAKVILTSRSHNASSSFGLGGSSKSTALGGGVTEAARDISIGAFVLPNAVIPDEVPLTAFQVPVESVEKAAGLTLFAPAVKQSAKQLCRETKCEVIVRRFDDARKGNAGGAKGGLIGGGRK
ncbi:hypothetical protein QFC21_002459 [Naganishia friedmannii]|uniref:Uncharacterized protein n=1 Tax=Naganishia friedmannii TaxID=89922 RepID=A0ACC2VYX5_9TREE|nr:hypothetical protein QFC21_002459 [Naganishia friedmannii]